MIRRQDGHDEIKTGDCMGSSQELYVLRLYIP